MKQIDIIKCQDTWRVEYMNFALQFQDARDETREEGKLEKMLELHVFSLIK